MKATLLIVQLITLLSVNVIAQQSTFEQYVSSYERTYPINSDSLMRMITIGNPFHVINNLNVYNVDPKDCYYNDSLKSFLLKFLNKDTTYHYIAELATHYGFDNHRDTQEDYIREFLKERKQMYLWDTILQTPDLYSAYFDTVFNLAVEKSKQYDYKNNTNLPDRLTDLLAKIKWPEVYVWARQQWESDGKKRDRYCYEYLLEMHDPEVIEMNNQFIDSWGKLETCEYDDFNWQNNYLYDNPVYREEGISLWGSYYFDALLHFLKIKTLVYHPMYDNDKSKRPYNTDLISEYFFHSPVFMESYPEIYKLSYDLYFLSVNDKQYRIKHKQASDYIIDHFEMFISALTPFKEYFLEKELYWKQHMPYYKKE